MVLVFDMNLSLLASNDGANFKTRRFRFYSRKARQRPYIFQADYGWIHRPTSRYLEGLSNGFGECRDDLYLLLFWLSSPDSGLTGG
jgi:hypothetical protein